MNIYSGWAKILQTVAAREKASFSPAISNN
jgi:hypothetical protein